MILLITGEFWLVLGMFLWVLVISRFNTYAEMYQKTGFFLLSYGLQTEIFEQAEAYLEPC